MKTCRLLFNDEMSRTIVAGRKTVTRRPVVSRALGSGVGKARFISMVDGYKDGVPRGVFEEGCCDPVGVRAPCAPGDLLIGRECWGYRGAHSCSNDGFKAQTRFITYRADGARASIRRDDGHGLPKQREQRDDETDDGYRAYLYRYWGAWTPSLHMPDWAARIRRRVVGVTVERLQDITENDAVREGFSTDRHGGTDARNDFLCAWDDIYVNRGLVSVLNPWTWRIEFSAENVTT